MDAYIHSLPGSAKSKVSSGKSRIKKSSLTDDNGEQIDTVDLNAMHTRKPRKFRNPRDANADDDFDDERETSGLDDSDVITNINITQLKAEEKTTNDASSTSLPLITPNRDSKASVGGGRKAKDGVFSPEDAKGEAKGTRKMSADEIIKQKGSS